MMIHLTEDQERFVRDAMGTGRYTTENDVVHDALERLRQTMPVAPEAAPQSLQEGPAAKRLTKQEFQRHLAQIGLIDEPAGSTVASGKSNDLLDEEGEIVSEAVIRERLIEWLVGFLSD
jgi:Arc/MetJ-type ribon-helix-helix transcriptional regulator